MNNPDMNNVNEIAQMHLELAGEFMEQEGNFPKYICFETEDGEIIRYECIEDGE